MVKIAVITGSRAEYGILLPLLKKLKESSYFNLQIMVTGMHLSKEYGFTYEQILNDGFDIDEKVDTLLSSQSKTGISKSVGLGIIGFADVFSSSKPDIMLVLGDRIEMYAATVAAYLSGITICHFHGGELTEGMIDDGIRHSISKFSTYHFTSTEIYRKRVIQLGEQPENVFNVGSLSLDNLKEIKLLSKEALESSINFEIDENTVLFTYHPESVTLDKIQNDLDIIFDVLKSSLSMRIIFTMPNSDFGSHLISDRIIEFVNNNPLRSISVVSLGQTKYLSALKYVCMVIGNSSSGIIEVPSFGIPTINIGNRQKGRIKSDSVIDVILDADKIVDAIKLAKNDDFRLKCSQGVNPYEGQDTSNRIMRILGKLEFKSSNINKSFFDIKFESEV